MDESCSSDSEGSDSRGSSLSLQYSASTFEDASSRDSDEHADHDSESRRVEPYLYEPEGSEEESTASYSGIANDEDDDDPRRERLHNTSWLV